MSKACKSILIHLVILLTALSPAFAQNKPYPQAQNFPNCIKPNNVTQASMNASVITFYNYWKGKYLKNNLSTLPGGYYVLGDITGGADGYTPLGSSEGQGYGMIITALMAGYDPNAQTYFDGLYKTARAYKSSINANLMGWVVADATSAQGHFDSATDGDMDIAYALILAHYQWGSAGTINYLAQAQTMITSGLKASYVTNSYRLNLGDWASKSTTDTRPSDWMLSHFKAYKAVTNDGVWDNVSSATYAMITALQTNYSSTTGLMPDFATGNPVHPAAANFLESENDPDYYYNACRTPLRFVMDFAHYGDAQSKTVTSKMVGWAVTKTGGNPANFKAGYTLTGNNVAGNGYQSGCFIAPMVAAATCDAAYQNFLNTGWGQIINMREGYFEDSYNLLCQLYISGNWWVPQSTTLPPSSINFNGVTKTYGDAPFSMTATSNSTGALSYSITAGSAFASINSSSGLVTITGAGTVTVQVSQAASASFAATTKTATLTINKANLTATADNKSRPYFTANPTFTITYSGFVYSDNASVITPAIATGTGATINSNAGTYPITLTGGSAANYNITRNNGTLTITKLTLTATADIKSRPYYTSNPTFTITYTGFVNGENSATLSPAPVATCSAVLTSNAGTYPITLSSGNGTNYNVTVVNSTLTITKLNLTATADAKSRPYYTANPTFTITYTGFVNGESASALSPSPVATCSATLNSNAGTYPITLSASSATNYTVTLVNSALTVTKIGLTATAENKSRPYYTANPAFTITYTGFVNGETAAVFTTSPVGSCSATLSSDAGTYPITLSAGVATNYTFTAVNGTLTVTPLALTATADNATRVYNTANPTFTISYSGFVNGETAAVLSNAPTASTTATISSNVGTYPITLSGGTAINYTITLVSGTLNITKATPMLVYTGATSGPESTVITLSATTSSDATPSYSVSNASGTAMVSGSDLQLSTAGTVTLTVSIAATTNYEAASVTQTITITPVTANLNADEAALGLYPTITSDYTTLHLTNTSAQGVIVITDVKGIEVLRMSYSGEANVEFNVSTFTSGFYLVRLITEEQVYAVKMIKQ